MTCAGCGVELTKRHQRTFCSNRCQRAQERKVNLARWLATGEGTPSSGPGHFIRIHLMSEQGGACAVCGGPQEWMGRELRFVLDHVNGDSTDNCRENLRLVCPNCDSQLDTYKARNRGRGRAWRRARYASGQSY